MSLISFVISHYDCSVRCSCLKFFSFQVIAVPWPNNTDIQQLSPSHVVVRRCSGGCHGSRSCVAGATKVRSVSVMLARCPVGGGKCEKQCASLEVEDEVECQCGCPKHLEQECLAKVETHSWSRETCGCECRDEKERRSCLESGGKVWDSSSCSCLCPLSLQTCSSGLRLDLSSCSCLPDHLAGQIETRGAAREDRESQDTSSLTTYLLSRWIEVLVIGLLAFTAVLLAILCGVFLRRIHQLKTQLNNTRTSHVNVSPNLYSPCPVESGQSSHHFSPGLGQTRIIKPLELESHLGQVRPANKMVSCGQFVRQTFCVSRSVCL